MHIEDWNKRWFGYWGGKSIPQSGLPCVDDFADPDWRPRDKKKLLNYLEKAPVLMTSGPSATCLVCGCDVGNNSKNHSDGVWVWPAGLSHYVREHAVVLPQAFVDHIRERKYSVLSQEDIDWSSLDWPKPE
jgi:hypothetical protein